MADAIAAPIVNAIARNVVGSAGVQLEIAAPYSAFDAFQVEDELDVVNIFLATPSAAAVGISTGAELVMISGLQRVSGFRVAVRAGGPMAIGSLEPGAILVQGRPGDQAPLSQVLRSAGVDPGAQTYEFQDPTLPLDPTPLFDGSLSAILLNSWDGLARIQEYSEPETNSSVGPEATMILAGNEDDLLGNAPGFGLWVPRRELEVEDKRVAMALTIIALADGLTSCRDDIVTCADLTNGASILDRYGNSVLWSINEYNKTLWPAPDGSPLGALTIDKAKVLNAIADARAVGVVSTDVSADSLFDMRVIELVEQYLPTGIDLVGNGWEQFLVDLPLQ